MLHGSLTVRIDQQRLVGQLSDAIRILEDESVADHHMAAQLLVLGRILFTEPLKTTTQLVRTRWARTERDIASRLFSTAADEIDRSLEHIQQNLEVLSVSPLAKGIVTDAKGTLGALLARGQKYSALVTGAPALYDAINAVRANAHLNQDESIAQGAIDSARKIRDRVIDIDRIGTAWSRIGGAFDHAQHIAEFEAFFTEATGILAGTTLPKNDPPRADCLAQFVGPLRSLALDVLRELSFAPILDQSVLRLRVAFEAFEKTQLLAEMEREWSRSQAESLNSGKTPCRANERVLQVALDRFLFAEGILPLTHVQAAGGLVDSVAVPTSDFAREATRWLREYADVGVPPALIELKQAVALTGDTPTTDVAVKKLVKDGIQQVNLYADHLRAIWPTLTTYVVVGYNGRERFLLPSGFERVLLVYLGDVDPSKKKSVLDVSDFAPPK